MLYLSYKMKSTERSVLFVCTANICRSPMAAALFRTQIRKKRADGQNWRVDSAGTWVNDGQSAADGSCEVMRRRGVDLSGHRSKSVTRELIGQFDLVLAMEPGHKEAMRLEFPEFAERIFLLSEMQGGVMAVRDPYGGPLSAYEIAANTIESMITKGIDRIIALVEARHVEG